MSHTPGPWSSLGDSGNHSDLIVGDSRSWPEGDSDDGFMHVAVAEVPHGTRNHDADERLIVAAPDLLDALDNAHGILQENLGDVDPHVRAACDLMWTAITKARGES